MKPTVGFIWKWISRHYVRSNLKGRDGRGNIQKQDDYSHNRFRTASTNNIWWSLYPASVDIREATVKEQITILKLPPYSSHLLQFLDLAVFKYFKNKLDKKFITLLIKHIGQKSQFLYHTWTSISPEVIINGFKKGVFSPSTKVLHPRLAFFLNYYESGKIRRNQLINKLNGRSKRGSKSSKPTWIIQIYST